MTDRSLLDLLAPLRAHPDRTALLFDFDGTLSPIVAEPADARPADGVIDVLARLAGSYRTVGIVSGRPVAFLAEYLPDTLALSGLYGLEWRRDGAVHVRPGVDRWRATVAEAVADAEASAIDGLFVESKGLSVTLHFRRRPRSAAAVTRLAGDLAARTGLEARPAKMSIELHPPVATDKGLAVRELAAGSGALLYAGDDLGDLPAFAALTELRAEGLDTVGVAVATAELPDSVRAAADAWVDGPGGLLGLLHALLP